MSEQSAQRLIIIWSQQFWILFVEEDGIVRRRKSLLAITSKIVAQNESHREPEIWILLIVFGYFTKEVANGNIAKEIFQ